MRLCGHYGKSTAILDNSGEELEVKKRLVEQIDQMDKQCAKSMAKMSQNMEKLTNCVADGFTLLKTFMLPQPGPMYHTIHSNITLQLALLVPLKTRQATEAILDHLVVTAHALNHLLT